MINADMRQYNYYLLTDKDEYGQQMPLKQPNGVIKMAINLTAYSIKDNIKYSEAAYLGLTTAYVDDTYIIEYESKRLKVLYVSRKGRFTQVYMNEC